jgi:hypothetical protein
MNGRLMLYRDQWGNILFARTTRELQAEAGGGRIAKMYTDKKDGTTVQVGYIVGRRWLTAYQPVELPA